jgi:hypothetical protein
MIDGYHVTLAAQSFHNTGSGRTKSRKTIIVALLQGGGGEATEKRPLDEIVGVG